MKASIPTVPISRAYIPGLDGLRALAVLAVLLYHSEGGSLPGGFLGVEIFFVISGYLITSLLLAEWVRQDRIDVPRFWLRRARRLLPALWLMLAGVLTWSVLFFPDQVAGLRSDAVAALGYVTNWYLILGQKSYFETLGRPLFQHLWSLAVEEQFYLLWPLLLILLLRVWRPRQVLFILLAGAALSATWMALLYQPDADPSRVYYGTDTRAAGLLMGAALAFLMQQLPALGLLSIAEGRETGWRLSFRRRWIPGDISWLLDAVGLAALGALGIACLEFNEFQPLLYRGGFLLVGIATVLLIGVIVHPRARWIPRLLGWEPLRRLGQRSYGIYLWHWPVFMLTRPQLDVPLTGVPLLALRLSVTLILAEISFRVVETPIRGGAIGRAWKAFREAEGSQRRSIGVRWAIALGLVGLFSFALGDSVVSAQAPTPPAFLIPATGARSSAVNMGARASATLASEPTQTPTPLPSPTPSSLALVPAAMPAPKVARATHVVAIGDSVMLGAGKELVQDLGDVDLDAVVGRQVSTALALLQTRVAAGPVGPVVVIHLGNNGTFSARQFDQMMGLLSGTERVVFVNVRVPRAWSDVNDQVLAQGVKRYPNAVLVDWNAASANHPEYYTKDGVHLRPAGVQAYAALIEAAVNAP